MVISQKTGNLQDFENNNLPVDWLELEWFETQKRILHKRSRSGMQISMKFMGENQRLTEGDILVSDTEKIIAVSILPCDVIVIRPASMQEMAAICYEIGNKHLPLFYYHEELLVAYDAPLFKLLSASGYSLKQDFRKLLNPLKTTVEPHGSSKSLFAKIMELTGEK